MYIKLINDNIIISSNYGIYKYLRWLQKGCGIMTATSSQQRQAAVNFDVSPYLKIRLNVIPKRQTSCG